MTWKRCMIAALCLVCVAMVTYVLLRRPPSGPNTTAATVAQGGQGPAEEAFSVSRGLRELPVGIGSGTGSVHGPRSWPLVILYPAPMSCSLRRRQGNC